MNRKFLLILVVLLAIVLFPLVRGLVSGFGAPGAAPAPVTPPVDVETVPGTGAATGFDACAVLGPDVVAAAGLKYASAVVKTEGPGVNSCGGPVEPGSGPEVLLTVGEQKVSGAATSHGIRYERQDGGLDVVVVFPAAKLQLTHFAVVPGGEGVLAKLIDGVAARLAAGPKPAPGYHYPAPYDLTAKPCDALPDGLFTALTAHPAAGSRSETFTLREAFSVSGSNIKISCARESAARETVMVTQTIYRDADAAAAETRFLCETQPGWTASPAPIGDSSCASPGAGGQRQVLFRAGRDRVVVEYRADHPPAGDFVATAGKVYESLPR
ncbi:hypothetical protein SAMN05421837_11923 [Amycolatopsis pretoriensis]|uniref:Uncharacterized protein n=1 Tax=Amycolatopsis pretoriensis TaxID=218821 RepID=A0A1H5RIN5_9PSEU|nr:hypothetical protein [Amycolatopsis pretoriensis]SEF38189.1 hypothetical protein SAMN05421837_11923 [Amycolatopsis pretoriensis]